MEGKIHRSTAKCIKDLFLPAREVVFESCKTALETEIAGWRFDGILMAVY
jgi:hypothetical protein